MEKRVVITGLGPVVKNGIGMQALMDILMNRHDLMEKLPEKYLQSAYEYKSQYRVPAPDIDLKALGIPIRYKHMAGHSSQMAMASSVLALKDAGFQIDGAYGIESGDALKNAGVIIGTGFNNIEAAFGSYMAHNQLELNGKKERYNRMMIPIMMNNAPSGWVSLAFGIRGENYTVNAACASGTFAVGEMYRKIQCGDCDIGIAGGVESLMDATGAVMRGFDQLGTLTNHPEGRPQPFSRLRSGFLFNEGAGCMLILESLEHAKARGAEIYAEICGYKASSDAYNIVQMEPSGQSVEELIKDLKGQCEIGYINSHGTGTLLNDEIEAGVIHRIFGGLKKQPILNSTKSILGHSIGASGALEAAVTAYAVKTGWIHPSPCEDPLDNINLAAEKQKADIDYALSLSYGFGGHNAGLLIGRYRP